MTTPQTLADLVAIDSVSSRSNTEIISYLEQRCRSLGLSTQRYSHVDDRGLEKINLVAQTSVCGPSVMNSQTEVCATELALVGHTDKVPYDPNWKEALTLTERDGKLFGRGACDTKAFIAAALTAVESIDINKLAKPLALVFTSDEEIGCLGAKRLADAKPFTVKYAIVSEPTSLQPRRAGKGYCLAHVTVRGREAHSAYPQIGASAIFRAARLIERIEGIAEELKDDQHKDFDPPFTTLNIGLLNGRRAKNIWPGECRFTLEWRTVPGQASQHVLKLVKHAVAELLQEDADFVCEIDAARADESFETAQDSALVDFLQETVGKSQGQ